MLISIIIPCFNEEDALPLFMERFLSVAGRMEGVRFETLFVDDGSSDGTLPLLKQYARDHRGIGVRALSFSRNFGKEAALYAGIAGARGDMVAVMDADLQDPPELLIDMLDIMRSTGCDCVATRRVTREGEPKIRSFFARLFYRLINRLTSVPVRDGVRDFRLMRRKMVDAIMRLPERRRFSKGLFAWVGFDVRYVTYHNIERAAGITKWSFWALLRYAFEGFINLSTKPLSIPFFFAVLSAMACVALLFFSAWIAAIVCGAASIIFLALGVFGVYLARAFQEVKKRPLYIEANKAGADQRQGDFILK